MRAPYQDFMRYLQHSRPGLFTVWCVVAAFTTYFSMYAFRKPFTAATYEELALGGVDYKVILIFAQVGGYALSKFLGIRIISEMTAAKRAWTILGLIGVAHLALLPFAVAPIWLKPVFLFFNGLPLGMVYGCVFAYLEGRRVTEATAAGLCASFICASGFVKSAGAMLMTYASVPQFWMPFATGALFWTPLIIGVWMLQQIPPPSLLDIQSRSLRPAINSIERRTFFSRYAFGFSLLILIVVLLTVFRTVRDDYAPEIWADFGITKPDIFARSETIVAVIAVLLSATTVLIRDNHRAFLVSMSLVATGFACALATVLGYWHTSHWTESSAFCFMVLIGIALYVPYVLFHTTVYERLLAILRDKGNIGYLMYMGDFAGYMCAVILMVTVNWLSDSAVNYVSLLIWIAVVVSPLSIASSLWIMHYFRGKARSRDGDTMPKLDPHRPLATAQV